MPAPLHRLSGSQPLATFLAAVALSTLAQAASVDWDNSSGTGVWQVPTNWSTDVVPIAPDDAVFINAAAGPASITATIPAPRDIRFGDEEGRVGSGTVNHSAGDANLTGWVRMGITAGSGGTYNLRACNEISVAKSAGIWLGLIDA